MIGPNDLDTTIRPVFSKTKFVGYSVESRHNGHTITHRISKEMMEGCLTDPIRHVMDIHASAMNHHLRGRDKWH